MNVILTMTRLTFHEAWRRWMVLMALVLGAIFVVIYAAGFYFISADMRSQNGPEFLERQGYSFLLLAGLYVVHFLSIMLAIFASVDTISGEISSHTVQALVTKPVHRWQLLLGKWLGYAAMLVVYLLVLGGGIMLATWLLARYIPPNPVQGLLVMVLEALVLLSLSMLGGTRLSTLTNGVMLFMLYGLAFVGSWVEQIGSVFESDAAVRIGIITSLIMPVESLWRRAAFLLQADTADRFFSPFSALSVPSPAMVGYAMLYTVVALLVAMRSFNRRDL